MVLKTSIFFSSKNMSIWPKEIKDSDTINTFKAKIKKWVLWECPFSLNYLQILRVCGLIKYDQEKSKHVTVYNFYLSLIHVVIMFKILLEEQLIKQKK